MTATVLIPAAGVVDGREALLCLLKEPVEAIKDVLTLPERELHPEWFEDGRHQFEQVCRLLDLVGWDTSAPAADVQVPGEHADTLREAIEGYLPLVEGWLPEAKALRERREHRASVQAMCSLLADLREVTPSDQKAA
jgi:hypothetical protein